MVVKKIISGGQSGADQGGLAAGKQLGLETGGTAPKNWITEFGTRPILLKGYGLVEDTVPGYNHRTGLNIKNSDGTVVFGDSSSVGSRLTIGLCGNLNPPKPCILNPGVKDFLAWLEAYKIETLNVAGNRESRNWGIKERTRKFLVMTLKICITCDYRSSCKAVDNCIENIYQTLLD